MKKEKSNGIVWNRVTTFSKFLALVLFIAFPIAAFWFGVEYGFIISQANISYVSSAPPSGTSSFYSNTSEWQTEINTAGGYSIKYPFDFDAQEQGTGRFAVTVPSAFQPDTNFIDAELTVAAAGDNTAVATCLTSSDTGNTNVATSTAMINGSTFTIFKSSDAGAGQIYETTSYRTLHAGQCYVVEYTIHSTHPENYPSSYNVQPFDDNAVQAVLDRIVSTFSFQ